MFQKVHKSENSTRVCVQNTVIVVALREGMAGHGFRDVAGIDVTVASQVDTQRIGPIWTDLDQFGPGTG